MFVPTTGVATHYRLDGRKDLINGAYEHELLVVMARTGAPRSGGDINPLAEQGAFSLFFVDRSTAGVEWTKRWDTLPAPAADIASVLFDGVVVPEARRVGTEGGAWSLVQRTLAVTHGCIPACSSGISSHALRLACIHASERQLYGRPIIALGAIHRHVLTMAALDLITAALSPKGDGVDQPVRSWLVLLLRRR